MNGHFTLADGTTLSGALSLDGPDSKLTLWGGTAEIDDSATETITGILEDHAKVTLLRCLQVSWRETFGEDGISFRYEFFPHEVILGTRHLSRDDAIISAVSFTVDDIAVFYPLTAGIFGAFIAKPEQLRDLISSRNGKGKSPPKIGKRPHIAYYTDADGGEIFSVDTVIGKVSANNLVTVSMGGPDGADMKNRIRFLVRFDTPVTVRELHSRIGKILQFLDLVIGRSQNLLDTKAYFQDEEFLQHQDVHFTMRPSYERPPRSQKLLASDVLINTLDGTESICQVMSAWLDKDRNRSCELARSVFFTCWRKGRSFMPDRLAAAANAFDFLPSDQLPREPIEEGLEPLLKDFRKAVRKLPTSSIQREKTLNVIGQISAPRLKERIQHRAKVVTAAIGDKLPEIDDVLRAAVDCRNFIVHGPSSNRARDIRTERIARRSSIFLTKSLEFIFGVSDLVDAGWDLLEWSRKDRGFRHPFREYIRGYPTELAEFKRVWKGQDKQNKQPE